MTILSFADTRFPIERANGVQTMATCRALAARGHTLTLLVRSDSAAVPRDPFQFYGVAPLPSLTIEAVGPARAHRVQMLWTGLQRALTGRADVVYTRDLGLAAVLSRVPRRQRPRLVYESHGIGPVMAAAMPALLGSSGPTPSAGKLARIDRREARVWRHADSYVTITQALADDLGTRYGTRARVFVVPDGANPVTNGTTRRAPSSRLRAAYAGHLYPWKGVDIFLHALAATPDIDGLIVGGHAGEADLGRVTALAAALKLGERLTITGLLPPPEVAAAIGGAEVLVLPNTSTVVSERYTSPLKLFEYLASGRAIVASDLPALREVLTHNETALLVPAGDVHALADALSLLAADGALRERLGRAARDLSEHFTWERRAERLERAFAEAMA
ncbi:MAG: glycosyltransferase family 4 protein [Vicinamibacterales bacterium]